MPILEDRDRDDEGCVNPMALIAVLTSIRTMLEYNPAQGKQKLTDFIKELMYE